MPSEDFCFTGIPMKQEGSRHARPSNFRCFTGALENSATIGGREIPFLRGDIFTGRSLRGQKYSPARLLHAELLGSQIRAHPPERLQIPAREAALQADTPQ